MKSKILLFISLITYTLTEAATTVTVSSVATGACKDNKYTFVIKANANGDLAAGSATVTLASPENTTPTCTFAAVGSTQSSDNTGTNTGDNTETNTTEPAETNTTEPGGRRLATGDFDITCIITSKLDNADIKVNSVTIAGKDANGTFPVAMNGKATCHNTTTNTTTITINTTNTGSNAFIQISGFIFLLILTVF